MCVPVGPCERLPVASLPPMPMDALPLAGSSSRARSLARIGPNAASAPGRRDLAAAEDVEAPVPVPVAESSREGRPSRALPMLAKPLPLADADALAEGANDDGVLFVDGGGMPDAVLFVDGTPSSLS